jgi:hypothetical protein
MVADIDSPWNAAFENHHSKLGEGVATKHPTRTSLATLTHRIRKTFVTSAGISTGGCLTSRLPEPRTVERYFVHTTNTTVIGAQNPVEWIVLVF